MVAQLKEQHFPSADPDDAESAEAALAEVTRLFVEADARRGRLGQRMGELRMGAAELRRRRARTQLDAFLPPLRITSISLAADEPAPAPTLRGLLVLLCDSLSDVMRIWWGRHFMRWWRDR